MRRGGRLAALALFTGILTASGLAAAPPATVERRLALMGTRLDLTVAAADRPTALAASERAVAAREAAEARLSTWRDDSELARLNRAPVGAPFALSPTLAAELAAARQCWAATGGAFDPTVGPLVAAWGLRGGGRLPSAAELRRAVAATGMDGLSLSAEGTAVRRRPGVAVEEGGFGKGAGLRAAVAALAGSGAAAATLDLGGQLALFGPGRRELAVADPRRRDRPVVTLAIDRGSVATSGNSERGIEAGGRHYGHLLDPRTGRPAPDFGSLTVWTDDPLTADCLSKLYVLGPERALDWAAAHPGVEVLALLPRGKGLQALASRGLAGRLAPIAGIAVEIEFR
ncbi:MAG TPA: FAD:protein FMN transferase [Thermoanaerobaculia bacterium]|jgi:thiamine biosynthesis lipoprotein|nr:FAD:protein FMN transferase [Thermoanaerobaculia bacterium]